MDMKFKRYILWNQFISYTPALHRLHTPIMPCLMSCNMQCVVLIRQTVELKRKMKDNNTNAKH